MNRRALRNYVLMAAAAVSGVLEAPRLSRTPLNVAAAELTDAPAVLTAAVNRVSSAVSGSYLGFDTNVYPGDRAMDAWKRSGEYQWVGYYPGAPCHSDGTWVGKREHLVNNGWGLAVIYVGQQTWGNSYKPVTTTTTVRVATKMKKGKRHYVTRSMKRTSTIPVANSADGRCSAS